MKRLLSALALFFVCAAVSAQTIYQGSPNQNVLYKGVVGADSGLFIKPVADLGAGRFAGHIRCKTDGTCYIWDGTTWKGLGGGGSADMSAVAAAIRDSLYRYYDTATVNQMFADQSNDFNAALDGVIAYGDEHWGGGGGIGRDTTTTWDTTLKRNNTAHYDLNIAGHKRIYLYDNDLAGYVTIGGDSVEVFPGSGDLGIWGWSSSVKVGNKQNAGHETIIKDDTLKVNVAVIKTAAGGEVQVRIPSNFSGKATLNIPVDLNSNDTIATRAFGRNLLQGAGTVSSVGLTMPSAFSVTGSPVTSAGTLSVTGNGTAAQYVTGTGALATFAHTHPIADITGLPDSLAALRASIDSSGVGSSPWSVSGSDVYRSSGKVGIGTSSPGYNLDVVGSFRAGGATYAVLYDNATGKLWLTSNAGTPLSIVKPNIGIGAFMDMQDNATGGSISIGSSSSNFAPSIIFNPGSSTNQKSFLLAYSSDPSTAVPAFSIDARKSTGPLVNQPVFSVASYGNTYMQVNAGGAIQYYTVSSTPPAPPPGSAVQWFDGTNMKWKKNVGGTVTSGTLY